jgi:hypothetical protein
MKKKAKPSRDMLKPSYPAKSPGAAMEARKSQGESKRRPKGSKGK